MNTVTASHLKKSLEQQGVTLVAVSKTQPIEIIQDLYDEGFRIFGENRVQELVQKQASLPNDIQWHMIGSLQKNKVKYIAPFVSLIHSVSSLPLLLTIDKEARKNERTIDILLQLKIAKEDTKSGLTESEAGEIMNKIKQSLLSHTNIVGFMGMATFTDDKEQVRTEFQQLMDCAQTLMSRTGFHIKQPIYSMGMSGDYNIAIEEGANMVRIGSLLFGQRQ